MKKGCFVLFVIALLLSGCGLGGNENQNYIDISKIYQTEEEHPAQSYWRFANMKKMGTGYYFTLNNALYYWDSKTQNGSICCSASNCSHSSEKCSAYFGAFGENWKYGFSNLDLEIFNNRIYKIGYKFDEVTDLYIYSMDLDGTNRAQLGYIYSVEKEFDGAISLTYDWCMIDGYYYGAYSSDKDAVGLYKIRVDGEKKLVLDVSSKKNASIDRVQGIGKLLYFTLEWEEGSKENGDLVYKTNFMRYDTETGKTETVLENSTICEYCFLDEEHIFYSDIKENCYLLDLKTKEENCVVEGGVESFLSSDGKYLYVDKHPELCVYTPEGTLVDTIRTDVGSVLYGDQKFLFVYAPIEPGQQATEEEYKDTYLWILDKSQLGLEEKQWMKMELE